YLAFGAPVGPSWLGWVAADGLGIMLVGGTILIWAADLREGRAFAPNRRIEFALLCLVTAAIGMGTLGPLPELLRYPYMLLPPMFWAAMRFGPRGTTATAIILTTIILYGALSGRGMFRIDNLPISWGILAAQIFLAVMIVSALLLATSQYERDHALGALERANAELQIALNRTQALYNITNAAIQSDDLSEALQHAIDRASTTINADRILLLMFDWSSRRIEHFLYGGRGAQRIYTAISFDEFMSGLTGWAIRERRPAISPKHIADPRESAESQRRRSETRCGSIVVVPLYYIDDNFGTLTAINQPDEPDFTFQDVELLEAVAGQISIAYARAQLTEHLRQANQAKSAFLASMSHELRTPLNAILGFTGTLLMRLPGPLTEAQDRQLNTIKRSAQHLLALINDILDLARIESGRVEINRTTLHCQDLLNEVIVSLRPLAEQRGLSFHTQIPAEPIVVQSDSRALNQILINLINNAIKFTDIGEVAIHLTLKAGEVCFEIHDTGIGI
ncbi:MAG: GAF domain-containing protein, partial [Oscillochloris sp.]|nr:GAF domain-containing protein [Oscillochloris sp.]